ncbi:preprotein translocase subunit SecE [Patescibacteria group bacterium]|nr:preprotein translocase subunit SecE [Patescibacteria group bacterium]MBU3999668.1 preprotein translocase subunit SecE [Patescibacteria group bacterium]MBU4057159.1 preprotein translocase subunit SecE [Patescibacteria group bacterium]MBU4368352.1 preprotein translocase subunit SecE [Patescibacteria group bacterium]
MKIVGQITNFLKEVRQELAKVVFLRREELIKHTINVILISVAAAFILGGIDMGFNYLVNKIISSPR